MTQGSLLFGMRAYHHFMEEELLDARYLESTGLRLKLGLLLFLADFLRISCVQLLPLGADPGCTKAYDRDATSFPRAVDL